MTEYIQISTTTSDRAQAEQIANALVEQRLAACVQISGPIHSIYRWQGEVEQANEWQCTAKTRASLFQAVETEIRKLHTYECPEIIAVPVINISADYREWLEQQLTP